MTSDRIAQDAVASIFGGEVPGTGDLLFLDLVHALAPVALHGVYYLDFLRLKQRIPSKSKDVLLTDITCLAAFSFFRISHVHRFPGQVSWSAIVKVVTTHVTTFLGPHAGNVLTKLGAGSLDKLSAEMGASECEEHVRAERLFFGEEHIYKLDFCTACLKELGTSKRPIPATRQLQPGMVPAIPYARALAHELGLVPDDHGLMARFNRYLEATTSPAEKDADMAVTKVVALFSSSLEHVSFHATIPFYLIEKGIAMVEAMKIFGATGVNWKDFNPRDTLDAMCKHDAVEKTSFIDIDGERYAITSCTRCGKAISRVLAMHGRGNVPPIASTGHTAGLSFLVSPSTLAKYRMFMALKGIATNDVAIMALLENARQMLGLAAELNVAQDKFRRMHVFKTMILSNGRIASTWDETFTSLKVELPMPVVEDFRAIKARLGIRNNAVVLELFLALALERGT